MRATLARCSALIVLGWLAIILGAGDAAGQVPPLSTVPVPRPDLREFIRDAEAARVLGKALFWDMQVGSDGVQSCGTCHFRAGADPRKKNQVSPGLLRVTFQTKPDGTIDAVAAPDLTFSNQGPNDTLTAYRLPPPQAQGSHESRVGHPLRQQQRGLVAGCAPRDLRRRREPGPRP